MRIKNDFKTAEYYQSNLDRIQNNISRYRQILEKEERAYLYVSIQEDMKDIVQLKYILGYEISDIREQVREYIKALKDSCEHSKNPITYNQMAYALSYAYLFGIDSEEVEFVNHYKMPESFVDIMLDIIRNVMFKGRVYSDKTFYNKDTGFNGNSTKSKGGIVDVYNAPQEERTELFVKYLLDVKHKHHKKLINNYKTLTEDRYLYLPYDFLLTAVAKALNIEKEKIKDSVCIADELL